MVPAGPRASGRCMSTGQGIAIACCGRCTCRIFPRFRGKHPPAIRQNGGFTAWTPAPMHLPKWSIILPSRARSPPHHLFNKHTSVGTVYCPRLSWSLLKFGDPHRKQTQSFVRTAVLPVPFRPRTSLCQSSISTQGPTRGESTRGGGSK